MDNQNNKPMQYSTYDETKIYTPRYASQMQQEDSISNLFDHAPVRIYEKPLRREENDISKHSDLG